MMIKGSAVYLITPGKKPGQHEIATHCATARKLAALRGLAFAGIYEPDRRYDGALYYVPHDTIVSQQQITLNIRGIDDLFGGVVEQEFIGTKAITHPLSAPDAVKPAGWPDAFCSRIADCVFEGITAFSLQDAESGGLRLLERGPVRIKPVRAVAGRGQVTVHHPAELAQVLRSLDHKELENFGLVVEEFLSDVQTYSVGRVQVGSLVAAYYGTQYLTEDNDGELVYGGSELHVVRGGFEQLLALDVPGDICTAIAQAAAYDAAALECLPGFLASRRNYDVARGLDARGRARSGVLEQSWRIGGASSAEAAALEMFHADATLQRVRAASIELYGEHKEVPEGAEVFFRGVDSDVGFISKCVTVKADDDKERNHRYRS